MTPMLGYLRVSTEDQATNGYGLDAQRAALEAAAASRGWQLTWITDTGSGKSTAKRPGLKEALRLLDRHEAMGIAVAKLDRLSRSMLDFANLLERARKGNWTIVALDLGVDTSSPAGEMLSNVLMAFAQYERRLISARTTAALAAAKARGVRIGTTVRTDPFTVAFIHELHRQGLSYNAIARELDRRLIPTAMKRRWYHSTVALILKTTSPPQ